MALSIIEQSEVFLAGEAFLAQHRPPEAMREKLDLGYRIDGQSVFVFEIRPDWRNPKIIRHFNVAKATFVHNSQIWKVYWKRSDLKWHAYPPKPAVKTISVFFSEVSLDPAHCFFG
jgi:hypothetical protein